MYSKVRTLAFKGMIPTIVDIETSIMSRGIPRVEITGTKGEGYIKNIKKIRASFNNSGIPFPNKRILINILPSNLLTNVTDIEFSIVMGILFAQADRNYESKDIFYGAVNVSGNLVPATKTIYLCNSQAAGLKGRLFLSSGSFYFNQNKNGLKAYKISSLSEAAKIVSEDLKFEEFPCHILSLPGNASSGERRVRPGCLHDMVGNEQAKRALSISIAGHHNILLLGSSGVGKSILALESMNLFSMATPDQKIERAKVSVLANDAIEDVETTPFIRPEISTGIENFFGGSRKPGEITLAHKGILFMEELHLFPHKILNLLRMAADYRKVEIGGYSHPSDFLLIACANNCMCGSAGSSDSQCKCTGRDINRYNSRMSPALLERFDLMVHLSGDSSGAVTGVESGETCRKCEDCSVKKKIDEAVSIQRARFKSCGIEFNSYIPFDTINKYCSLDRESESFLKIVVGRYKLSTRAVHRILAVSRTIADLEGEEKIKISHVAEAVQFRVKNDKP